MGGIWGAGGIWGCRWHVGALVVSGGAGGICGGAGGVWECRWHMGVLVVSGGAGGIWGCCSWCLMSPGAQFSGACLPVFADC
jgi:hypothetical protein